MKSNEKKTLEKASSLVRILQKFRFLSVFKYCFLYLDKLILFFFVKKPKKTSDKKQVLITPNLGVGDAIQFLTTVEKYREAYPKDEYEITFMCRQSVIDIFKNEADFEHFEVINIDEGMFNLKKRIENIKKINEKYYDIYIDPIGPFSCSMNVFLSASSYAKEKVTILNKSMCIVPKSILKKAYTKIYEIDEENYPMIKHYNKLIDCILNNEDNEKIDFHRTKEYKIEEELPEEYYIIFPSSKLEKKKWPVERYKELAQKIYDRTKITLLITGTKEDEETISELTKDLNVDYYVLKSKLNIMQFIQIIKNAKFVISNDTGAYHIAVSENVPVTIITGGYAFNRYVIYDFESNQEYRKPYIVSANKECFNCNDNCKYYKNLQDKYPCLMEITVEDAWRKVEKMIDDIKCK